jgi:NAD-dependent deacetylase
LGSSGGSWHGRVRTGTTDRLIQSRLAEILAEVGDSQGTVVVLTGAGISAESGIPTFRGTDGYWVVGSRNYLPQEMATREMFDRRPDEVWRWYLCRFGACAAAEPNAGHRVLVDLEKQLGARFTLVTQNIDGLHRRAGSKRLFTIHGDAAWVRCAAECGLGRIDKPEMGARDTTTRLTDIDRARLTCPRCGGWLRPHVLWFDECYDEENYSMDSVLAAMAAADLLLVVGTSGATSLPTHMGRIAFANGAALVDVNPERNPFADLAAISQRGFFARGSACERLPAIVAALA